MSRAAELLRGLDGHAWTDEDGDEQVMRLLPPLSPAEIDALAAEWGIPVPSEVRAVLAVARGMEDVPLESLDFTASRLGMDLEGVFPHAVPFAGDGAGNYWFADLAPGADGFGPVLYVDHETDVVVYQCADLAEFIEALVREADSPAESAISAVSGELAAAVRDGTERVVSLDQAAASGDAVLATFARGLPEGFRVADLRDPALGDGFSVKRPEHIIRHSTERLFGLPPKPRGWAAGLLAHLRG